MQLFTAHSKNFLLLSFSALHLMAVENSEKLNNCIDDRTAASKMAELLIRPYQAEQVDEEYGLTFLQSAELIKSSYPEVYGVIKSSEIQKELRIKLLHLDTLMKKPGMRHIKAGKYEQKQQKIRKLYQEACEFSARYLPEKVN